jgi:hypothetical protein
MAKEGQSGLETITGALSSAAAKAGGCNPDTQIAVGEARRLIGVCRVALQTLRGEPIPGESCGVYVNDELVCKACNQRD